VRIRQEIGNGVLVLLGTLSAGMGLKGFLLSSGFIDGGVTGVSMLLARVTPLSLAVWLPVVNLPFLLMAWREVGARFAARSTISIAVLALVLRFVRYPDATPDPLLTAVFGGFFLGAGIGLAMRGGAVLDGTEVAALLISKRTSVFRVGDVILMFNAVLFVTAIGVLGVEKALYSILTYVAAARTLDFVLHGLEEYTTITIVSAEHDEIRRRITEDMGRGVTVFKGMGGLARTEQHILYCVVTRLEIGRVKGIVKAVDGNAFIVTQSASDVEGGTVKRKALDGH
jgi:uncharacterized membrane-anchored protein YitT (DUF2179 family)